MREFLAVQFRSWIVEPACAMITQSTSTVFIRRMFALGFTKMMQFLVRLSVESIPAFEAKSVNFSMTFPISGLFSGCLGAGL